MTQRPFEELNLWQRIFMEHWTGFAASYEREHGRAIPEHWQENVERMLSCGDIREGYYEYQCQDCHTTKKVGFTCKSRLCLRCFKMAVDEWLNQARKVLFDCDCMPESGPVERLVIYLCKYVSAPPISIRRIENYDGQNVTYRYEDHRKGEVHETIPASEFIGRMIRHLPPKGFRMVRYYGIYARPVRKKIHALVADALQVLVRRAGQVAQYFARQCPGQPNRQKLEERFAKGEIRCPACGSANMLLIRIWTKTKGVVYEWGGNLSARTAPVTCCPAVSLSPVYRQLTLAI